MYTSYRPSSSSSAFSLINFLTTFLPLSLLLSSSLWSSPVSALICAQGRTLCCCFTLRSSPELICENHYGNCESDETEMCCEEINNTGNWINCQTPPGDAVVVVSDPQPQPEPLEPFIPNILWPFLIGPDGGTEAGTELWKKWFTSSSPIISDRSAPPPPPSPLSLPPHPPSSTKMIPCLSSIRRNKKNRLNLDLGNGNGNGSGNGDSGEGNDESLASDDGKKEKEDKDGRVGGYDYCDHGSLI